ncbi:MAG: mlhB [Solirubrobacterales bacterium]|nr:mlhB [Solirubrobacterales bacterium]
MARDSQGLEQANALLRGLVPPGELTMDDYRRIFSETCAGLGLADDARVEPVDAGGVPALWVSAPGASADRAILHLHSGGFVMGSAEDYRDFAYRLSAAAGARVLALDYRLAPEHPFPAALDDALAGYRWLVDQLGPGCVAVTGDSAGGGLAVSLLLALREAGDEQPPAAAVISPLTDLGATGETLTTMTDDPLNPAALIPMMGGAYLAGKDPAQTPLASPHYGELHDLAPLLVVVGGAEGLLDDARRLAAKIEAAGGDVELHVVEDMPHIHTLFASLLPEGVDSIERVARFVREGAATEVA